MAKTYFDYIAGVLGTAILVTVMSHGTATFSDENPGTRLALATIHGIKAAYVGSTLIILVVSVCLLLTTLKQTQQISFEHLEETS